MDKYHIEGDEVFIKTSYRPIHPLSRSKVLAEHAHNLYCNIKTGELKVLPTKPMAFKVYGKYGRASQNLSGIYTTDQNAIYKFYELLTNDYAEFTLEAYGYRDGFWAKKVLVIDPTRRWSLIKEDLLKFYEEYGRVS